MTPDEKILDRSRVNDRDFIIFGQTFPAHPYTDIRRFDHLTPEKLRQLIALDVADPLEKQNHAPDIQDLLGLEVPGVKTFGGYAVSPERDDYCVSIDRIYIRPHHGEFTAQDCCDLANIFAVLQPDEFDLTPTNLTAWWD